MQKDLDSPLSIVIDAVAITVKKGTVIMKEKSE